MTAIAYYLLKVLICSGILFLYYHAALKNKAFHQWNRFYLLSAVLLSLALPLLQFTIFYSGEEESKAIQLIQVMQSADTYLEALTVPAPSSLSPEQWILSGYLLICILLLSSFLISLSAIYSLLKKHTVSIVHNIKFVGTKEPGTPFSFLNYIFWNDAISLQSQTGQQIFQHELVHVKEKHTLDKLFLQIVLMLFWINPFFWLIRRELKFIHEFIADKKAVGDHGAEAFAAMIMQTVYPQQYHSITNQFFQTSIKRRLLMLTKIQNPKRAYFSRIIVLPLIALTVVIFSFRTESVPATEQISPQNFLVVAKEPATDLYNLLPIANDTPPAKSKKAITAVDVRTRKEIAITYSDGTSEVLTEQEANNRGLINNGGFNNEKNTGQKQLPSSTIRLKPGATSPLYVVDEKEITEEEMSKIDPKMIESVNVLKDKPAIDKYGLKGKNGVVEIRTKTSEKDKVTINPTQLDKPLYMIDGKESSAEEMNQINPNEIQSINVIKDATATYKYGEKGKNGVVEISLKKTDPKDKVVVGYKTKPKPNELKPSTEEIIVTGYKTKTKSTETNKKEIRAMKPEHLENSQKDTTEGNNDVITYPEEKLQNLRKTQKKTTTN